MSARASSAVSERSPTPEIPARASLRFATPPLPPSRGVGLDVQMETDESAIRNSQGEVVGSEAVTIIRLSSDGTEQQNWVGVVQRDLQGVQLASSGTIDYSLSADLKWITLVGADGGRRTIEVAQLLSPSNVL
ncbi:hypothetical protein AB1Y20_015878 [Prymnesium parvum]|uniref:Uncharacterized protein n=1 Tax=Prymnesium parvum TaxID=97485 RepID=A0AB34K486_PRYPA